MVLRRTGRRLLALTPAIAPTLFATEFLDFSHTNTMVMMNSKDRRAHRARLRQQQVTVRRREGIQTDQQAVPAIDVVGRQNTNTIRRIVYPVFAFPSCSLRRHPETRRIAVQKASSRWHNLGWPSIMAQ